MRKEMPSINVNAVGPHPMKLVRRRPSI